MKADVHAEDVSSSSSSYQDSEDDDEESSEEEVPLKAGRKRLRPSESSNSSSAPSQSPQKESPSGSLKSLSPGTSKRKKVYEFNEIISPEVEAILVTELENCPALWLKSLDNRHKDKEAIAKFYARCDQKYWAGREGAMKKWYNTQRRALSQGLAKLALNSGAEADDIIQLPPKEKWATEALGFMASQVRPQKTRCGVDLIAKRKEQSKKKKAGCSHQSAVNAKRRDDDNAGGGGIQYLKNKVDDFQKEVYNIN